MAKKKQKSDDISAGAESQLNLTVVALVALVAIVGLVALVMNAGSAQGVATGPALTMADDSNVAGQATYSQCRAKFSQCIANGGTTPECFDAMPECA